MKRFSTRLIAVIGIGLYAVLWNHTLKLFTQNEKSDLYAQLVGSDGLLQKILHLFEFVRHVDMIYKVAHYIILYVILQTFAIPGSTAMSVLGGTLFGRAIGMTLVAISTAIGSTGCYLLSSKVKSPMKSLPKMVDKWRLRMSDAIKSKSLFKATFLMVLIRMTPFTPNWVINLLAPHLNIPIIPYFVGTLIGIVPLHLCYVQFGTKITELQALDNITMSDAVDSTTLLALGSMAIVGWVPFLL